MVLVRMADQDGRRAAPVERCGQQLSGAIRSIQRTSRVEDNTIAIRMLDFTAPPADLLSTSVDGLRKADKGTWPRSLRLIHRCDIIQVEAVSRNTAHWSVAQASLGS